jgi:hypothetical protein
MPGALNAIAQRGRMLRRPGQREIPGQECRSRCWPQPHKPRGWGLHCCNRGSRPPMASLDDESIRRPAQPPCPRCGKRMTLRRVDPHTPGYETRTCDCSSCGYSVGEVVKTPPPGAVGHEKTPPRRLPRVPCYWKRRAASKWRKGIDLAPVTRYAGRSSIWLRVSHFVVPGAADRQLPPARSHPLRRAASRSDW